MPADQRAAQSPQVSGRALRWIAVLLFMTVWLGVHILQNVSAALMTITTGPQHASVPPAWPVR